MQRATRKSGATLTSLDKNLQVLKKMTAETREQMAFIYGVLEEIAQRQEIQSAWQIDIARQVFAPRPQMTRGSKPMQQTPSDMPPMGFSDTAQVDLASMELGVIDASDGDISISEMIPAEFELTAEVRAGEGIPQALINEITNAAEKILRNLSERRTDIKTKGLQSVRKILEGNRTGDDKQEPTIMVVPRKDEIH